MRPNSDSQTDREHSAPLTSDKNTAASGQGSVLRTHKDTLFRFIFRDKAKLLNLYNALNDSAYQDTDELTVTTLENILYIGYKNDLSFLIDWVMFLGEHQSTWNPNMCLRGMLYFSRLYREYIETHEYDMYGNEQIPLPFPQYTIFYNGTEPRPDRSEIRMSDAFQLPAGWSARTIVPALECRALVLNVNYGHNQRLMENCRPLMEYAVFIHYIRANIAAGHPLRKSVDLAVDQCLHENILTDILKVHRKEVVELYLIDFDAELHDRTLRREGRKAGIRAMRQLFEALQRDNRMDDLNRAITDEDFCLELLKEYNI